MIVSTEIVSVQNMKTLSLALTEFSPKLALLHTLSHLISITRGQYQSTSTTSKFFTSRARVTGSSPQLFRDLNSSENFASPLIDFLALDALVLEILEGKSINVKFFIIPDWPCAEWYKTLHEQIIAEAVKLPNEKGLFVVKNKNQTPET